MTERFTSKFSQIRGTEIPILRPGVPSFLGVPIARSPRDLKGRTPPSSACPTTAPRPRGAPPTSGPGIARRPPTSAASRSDTRAISSSSTWTCSST